MRDQASAALARLARLPRVLEQLARPDALSVFFSGRRGSPRALLLGIVAILLWQSSLIPFRHQLDSRYRLSASTGMWVRDWDRFFYFEYYRGLFPVMSTAADLENSAQGAERVLTEQGQSLQTEFFYLTRFGAYGRILPLWVDGLLRRNPLEASLQPFNILLFDVALVASFLACWNLGGTALGLITVALLGSYPFQLASVFEENVFSHPISVAVILLALHLQLIVGLRKPGPAVVVVPALSGIILGTFREIRSEHVFLIVSPILVYLTLPQIAWRKRLVLVGILLASVVGTASLWERHWHAKLTLAEQTVRQAGGIVYSGPRSQNHPVWHSLFCGFGDFGGALGYRWSDTWAYGYAAPILRERFRRDIALNPDEPYFTNLKYPDGHFLVKWESLPEYDEVIKEKILRDLRDHPLAFVELALLRFLRLFYDTAPVGLSLLGWQASVPFVGLASLPILFALVRSRNWVLLKLIGFTAPLAFTALLIYSGYGTTYYPIYHVLCAGIFIHSVLAAWPGLRPGTAPAPQPPPPRTTPR